MQKAHVPWLLVHYASARCEEPFRCAHPYCQVAEKRRSKGIVKLKVCKSRGPLSQVQMKHKVSLATNPTKVKMMD